MNQENDNIKLTYVYTNPKLVFDVNFKAYDTSHQKVNDKNKWQPDGPYTISVGLNSIMDIRKPTENDYHHHTCWDCYFPTDVCILEYWDPSIAKYKTKFISGSQKDIMKQYKIIVDKQEKIKKLFNQFINTIENEFKELNINKLIDY